MFSMDLPLSRVRSKIDSIKVQSINLGFGIHGAPDPENSIIAESQRIKSWKNLNLNFFQECQYTMMWILLPVAEKV